MARIQKTLLERSIVSTASPPRYKMALLTWSAAFPLLTAVNVLLGPLLATLPLPVRTFLLSGLVVSLLTYIIMPRLSRWCANWLLLPSAARRKEDVAVFAENPDLVQDNLSTEPSQIGLGSAAMSEGTWRVRTSGL